MSWTAAGWSMCLAASLDVSSPWSSGTLAAWPSLDVRSTSSGSDKRATWPNVWPDSLVQISLGRDIAGYV